MSEKVLVTGGAGFLGSALVKRLVGLDHKVVVLDNGYRGNVRRLDSVFSKIQYLEGDIREKETVINAAIGCKSIFHLAFINGTKYFYEKPELVLDVGVRGALNSIEAAKKHDINTYVLASSSEVYQQPVTIPTKENERAIIPDVLNPRFSYAGAKLISELLTVNNLRHKDIRDIIFRPHNIFGPDMGNEHVIPEIVNKLRIASENWRLKHAEIEIQGSGEETRAFCFVEDAIDQLLTLYHRGLKGEIYHIGIDNEITIKSLVLKIGRILDIEVSLKKSNLKSGGTTRRCPDISKIQSLGYEKEDNFLEGLETTVSWYKSTL